MDDKSLFTILRCAENAEGQVGRSGLLKILQGRDSRKLSKLKLDHLEEYGSLSFMRREAVLDHIDDLLDRGCPRVRRDGVLVSVPPGPGEGSGRGHHRESVCVRAGEQRRS